MELTRKLGYMPLALVQAGAYIAARGMSFKDYLDIYDEHFKKVFAKLPPTAVWQYGPRSVLTTWEISFEVIRESNEEATELLSVCSLLANEIKKDMLWRGMKVERNGRLTSHIRGCIFAKFHGLQISQ